MAHGGVKGGESHVESVCEAFGGERQRTCHSAEKPVVKQRCTWALATTARPFVWRIGSRINSDHWLCGHAKVRLPSRNPRVRSSDKVSCSIPHGAMISDLIQFVPCITRQGVSIYLWSGIELYDWIVTLGETSMTSCYNVGYRVAFRVRGMMSVLARSRR